MSAGGLLFPNALWLAAQSSIADATAPTTNSVEVMATTAEMTTPTNSDVVAAPTVTVTAESEGEPPAKKKQKYERSFSSIELANAHVVEGVPQNYEVHQKNRIAVLEKKASEFDRLMQVTTGHERFSWNDLGRRHLCAGLMEVPYASLYGMEQLLPCVMMGMFAAADIDVDPERVARNCPSHPTLRSIVLNGAADCLIWVKAPIAKAKAVFIGCDKGH